MLKKGKAALDSCRGHTLMSVRRLFKTSGSVLLEGSRMLQKVPLRGSGVPSLWLLGLIPNLLLFRRTFS